MEWVITYLQKKTVRNLSLTEIINLFGSDSISIENYDLVCSGQSGNIRKHEFFRIESANSDIFTGAHTIYWRNRRLSVTSLSALKRNILKITDLTSFERSTYLILHEYKRLVRLKNIRFMLRCPKAIIGKAFLNLTDEYEQLKQKKCRNHNTNKQMQEYIEKMIILQKCKHPNQNLENIIQKVNDEVSSITNHLKQQLKPPLDINELTDIFSDDSLEEFINECNEPVLKFTLIGTDLVNNDSSE